MEEFSKNTQRAKNLINTKQQELLDEVEKLQAKDKNDPRIAELLNEAKNWQTGGLLLDSVAGVLSGPNTNGAIGTIANAGKPWLAAEVGDYFKGKDLVGSKEHILAHTILGGAIAAATGNDALSGAIAAGGAEALAPAVSSFLYGNKKPEELTADEKQTISSIITLGGAGIGALVGGTGSDAVSSGQLAGNAVDNNFDLLQILSPATAAELSKDPTHKKNMQQVHELRKIENVVVMVNGTPYVVGLAGTALVPLSGSGIVISLSDAAKSAILKSAVTGAGISGGINAGTQFFDCKVSGGSSCMSEIDGNKVAISAGVGGIVGPLGLTAAGAAGVSQVTTGSIIKNSPALIQFLKNNPTGSVIWLNQTAVGVSSNNAGQGMYDYGKKIKGEK